MAYTSNNVSSNFGSSAPLNEPDGDMPALPSEWLDPAIAVEPQEWFARSLREDGTVQFEVKFPGSAVRRLTVDSMDKVISSTDRAIFLEAYPQLFQAPAAIAPSETEATESEEGEDSGEVKRSRKRSRNTPID